MVEAVAAGGRRELGLRASQLLLRQRHSTPAVERIRQWALAQGADPGSALRKALKYTLKRWDGLTVFLRAPEVPLANNYVARQLRDKGGGSQEPLRQRVPARPRGGRSLLLPHRDGAPARGGPRPRPAPRSACRDREPGHHHAPIPPGLTTAAIAALPVGPALCPDRARRTLTQRQLRHAQRLCGIRHAPACRYQMLRIAHREGA
ncbi:transposase [Myxococcus xanthus]|nr:transposase [Myxococcus xanthus]